MKLKRFEWDGPHRTGVAARVWSLDALPEADVEAIRAQVSERGDEAILELTARFDAVDSPLESLRVPPSTTADALAALQPPVRDALEVAATNIRAVAQAQVNDKPQRVSLAQGQTVTIREAAVRAAGVYAPGGRAAYPSTVLMCAIPAQVAGVERIALASPPGRNGQLHPLVLAAAELCGIDEIYAMGGAQAIFAFALGTETINSVNVIVGPGNAWVREAKYAVAGAVGIDSLAGPSELMVIVGPGTRPEWAALDLCAQAEHGADSPLVVVGVEAAVLEEVIAATERAAAERPGVADTLLGVVEAPTLEDAIGVANAFAPEHLELLVDDPEALAARVTTAGCVFAGNYGATAFGDYVAGSNHVLPTAAAGRFQGPLGPHVFRRKISTVEVSPASAAKLAPHVDVLARAEGFPVHAESAMIRAKEGG